MTANARLLGGGRYQVGELLGFGGMAEVHQARDLRLGRDVAIKTLRHDLARDATFQLRFRREAQNAASLNHPAIVAVYDTGEEHGPSGEELPYIVMEHVNGKTLKEILGIEGRLMPRRALELTADICSALDFSHRHGIIHRDIKPGNVMLTQTGQVKVMDFGIARALASGASTMTQTSAVIGTAQYLSPEQARGESVDARSDVYATGCVLFELLTGHPPFVGDNPVSVAYQHVREEPRSPSESNPDVTPEVDSVVLKALAKNPANRYQSAGEMRADLLRAVAGRPVLATPIMPEDQRTAMLPPQSRSMSQQGPSRQVSRVPDRRKQRAGATVTVVLITILGMLALGAVGVGLYLAANRNHNVSVPDLTGRTKDEADRALAGEKLTGRQIKATEGCSDATLNKVVKQSPLASASVAEGTEVVYEVCLPPGQVPVPSVVDLKQDEATKKLEASKLKVGKVTPIDSEKAEGTVISTNPAANTLVAEGSTVELKVSKGNQKNLPDVRGKTETEAELILKNNGFKFEVEYRTVNDPDNVGKVLDQTPTPDKAYSTNTLVTITVGKQANKSPSPAPAGSSTSPTA